MYFTAERAKPQTRQTQRISWQAVEIEQHLKQRRVAEIALGLQLVNQLLKRQVLMNVSFEDDRPDLLKQISKGKGVGERVPKDQRVYKETYELFRFQMMA